MLFGRVDGGRSIISTATTPGGMAEAWVPARVAATATLGQPQAATPRANSS